MHKCLFEYAHCYNIFGKCFHFRDANYYEKPEKISILNMTKFRNMTINLPVVIKFVSMRNPPLPSYIKPGEPQSTLSFTRRIFNTKILAEILFSK